MSEENKLRYIQHNKNMSEANFIRCKLRILRNSFITKELKY